jgi:hypothetical protein
MHVLLVPLFVCVTTFVYRTIFVYMAIFVCVMIISYLPVCNEVSSYRYCFIIIPGLKLPTLSYKTTLESC